jgi:hypothetical protein
MRALCLFALLGLAACGVSVNETATADGRHAYELRCGGFFETKMDCNLKASEICPGGFEPVDSRTGSMIVVCANRRLPPSRPA